MNNESCDGQGQKSSTSKADKPNTSALSDTCILNSGCAESSSTGANKKYAKKQSSTPGNSKTEIKKGIKQKIVNKVMSWNNSKAASSKSFASDDLTVAMDELTLAQETSEENLCKPDFIRARDSLENLLNKRTEKPHAEVSNSKSIPFSQDKSLSKSSPHSEAAIGSSKPLNQSISKVLNWDPWDKLGRKNKRENKRRKSEKNLQPKYEAHAQKLGEMDSRKDHTAGDEIRQLVAETTQPEDPNEDFVDSYEYQPYRAKNSKSVIFTDNVKIIHFNGGEFVGESQEPLKKELDQQIRNKVMRKGYCHATLAKHRPFCDDYMSLWFKR